jgi:hypothetical protein
MRRFLLLICLAILIPSTVLVLGATTESNESVESELKALKLQVKSLEKRVKTLETKLLAERIPKELPLIIPRQMPQAPKGWLKKEFNGIPYYVIPLQKSPKEIKSGKSRNPNP